MLGESCTEEERESLNSCWLPVIFLWQKFAILLQKKRSQATWSRELFEKIPKKLSYFKEVGGGGQVSSFLLLKSPHLANNRFH
jgi:hypothetical protein